MDIQKWKKCCLAHFGMEQGRGKVSVFFSQKLWAIPSIQVCGKKELGRACLTLLKAERESSGLMPFPLCPWPGWIFLWSCCRESRPCLWSCVPFVRKTSKEVGINSHLAVVLNLLPWVWCELGSCPAHRHLWSTWVSEQREWSEVAPSTR